MGLGASSIGYPMSIISRSPFEPETSAESVVHRLDSRIKVVLTVFFVLSCALLPVGAWWAYLAAWLGVAGVSLAARFPLRALLRRSLVALPFLAAAVTVAFQPGGRVLWSGPWGLAIGEAGVVRLASIVLRSWIAVQATVLLAVATPFPDLLHALRHLRLPAVFTTILAFLYRYLFVLTDEVGRLLRARAARSAASDGRRSGGRLVWRAQVAGYMAGQLFLRSLERSERVYQAMAARGYRGQMLTMRPHALDLRDWLALWLALFGMAALHALGRLA